MTTPTTSWWGQAVPFLSEEQLKLRQQLEDAVGYCQYGPGSLGVEDDDEGGLPGILYGVDTEVAAADIVLRLRNEGHFLTADETILHNDIRDALDHCRDNTPDDGTDSIHVVEMLARKLEADGYLPISALYHAH